jgi:L-iditol 2-dehydrogenase
LRENENVLPPELSRGYAANVKAAILHGREHLQIEDIAPPSLKTGEVRVRIEAALTCGTDLKVFKRGYHAKMIVPPAASGMNWLVSFAKFKAQNPGPRAGIGKSATASSQPIPRRAAVVFTAVKARKISANDLLFLNGAYAESIVIPARLVQKNLLRLKPETGFPRRRAHRTAGVRRAGRE